MMCVMTAGQVRAAITITTADNIYVGGTAYSGYGIYGAKAGEIAQLLNGTYPGTVQWNGANLNQLKSAVLIKVGSSSNPNVLNDDDLESLELLSGARFLDIDGSTLAEGANIAKIKAGPNIEAVTLPNQLTKEQVNAAGASLKACNAKFGSCMSLDAEMEEKEVTTYTYLDPCTSEKVEYTGEVTGTEGKYKGTIPTLTRDVTLISNNSTFSYENTKFPGDVVSLTVEQVRNADGTYKTTWTPESLKVALTQSDNPTRKYYYKLSDGTLIEIPSNKLFSVNMETGYVNGENWGMNEVDSRIPNPLTAGTQLIVETEHNYTYTYTLWNGEYDGPTYTCPAENVKGGAGAYYCELANPGNHYSFPITANYAYSYSYVGTDCNVVTVENSPTYPGETIELEYNQTVDLTATTQTVNVPKEGGNTTVVAYVNTPGTLYQATSLDNYDVEVADALIISGNINNADIAVNSGAIDCDQGPSGDSDKFTSTGATAAFYVNNKSASIKSIDMSDAVLENYRHLRVMYYYGANLESVVFPKTLEKIPNYCCYSGGNNGCANLANIVFPTNATTLSIGDYAFPYTAINSLLLPSNVTRVGDHAFSNCRNLYDVEMESLRSDCLFGNNVFEACPKLQHVTLSEKVQNIGDYMFNMCGLLESIRIPSTCGTIGSYAFQFCYSIHQITIPEGVRLIKLNAFEGAGLTDIYLMATSIATLPMIYAMSPGGAGPSSFTHQRTTGNNTVPTAHRDNLPTADYDEVMTWYQEEQSGAQGLGTGNCLTALHYPESMKPFFEAIDVRQFYSESELASIPMTTMQTGIKRYYTPDDYLAMASEQDKPTLEAIVNNSIMSGYERNFPSGATHATEFGTDEEGNPIEYQYLPQSYAVDPKNDNSGTRRFGPDKDGNYYPNQTSYLLRMLAGATSTQAGGVGGEEVASAWGWRQFPLASSVESIGEIPYEKLYDDTWYTMCFPWKMEDNQLFMAFNQKCEIVEFVGAEVLPVEGSDTEFNLVFHFDEVAKTYYMDDNDVEYRRERDGERVDGAGHNLYIYTPKNGGASISAPNPLPADPKNAAEEVKEQYGKYLSIKNIMVLPGHPYMIHPSIGAAPGSPAKVYINGVKKIEPGKGKYINQTTFDAVAKANKVERTVTSRTRTRTVDGNGVVTDKYSDPTPWKNPETGMGGKYYFIGNINDEVKDKTTGKISKEGYKDLPQGCYFLGAPEGTFYPKYYKRRSLGSKLWSNYSAIILPDADALAHVEGLNGMTVTKPSGSPAKGATMEIGAWDFDEISVIDENGIATVIEDAVEKDKSAEIVRMNVVYNIKGQVVRADSGSVQGLPKGIYIVNGKKYMVK